MIIMMTMLIITMIIMMIEEKEEDHRHCHNHLNLNGCSLGDATGAACCAVVDARVSCCHLEMEHVWLCSAFLAFLVSSQNLSDTQILGGLCELQVPKSPGATEE